MNKNLNSEIYKRFGLEIDKQKVENGFRKYFANKIWEATYPLRYADRYEEKFRDQLYEAKERVLDDCCRELFLDREDYHYDDIWDHKDISKFIDHVLAGSFDQLLINFQIFLNVFYKYSIVHGELRRLTDELLKYTEDFPMLGITVKFYKTKSPQILPAISKHLDREILDTLGVLDAEMYEDVLEGFEAGLKIFSKAKTTDQLKDVVEDMHASCDEIIKIITGKKNKGFKHATDKDIKEILGLNNHQKEIFKNLKNLMDEIKHGSKKDFNRYDVEMIISMTASFIRLVAVKHN